jgi:hypothetical protein
MPRHAPTLIDRRAIICSIWMLTIALLVPAQAQSTQPASREGTQARSEPETLLDAITAGEPIVNLRLRLEHAAQDGVDDATAATGRLRLGYRTAPWHGLSFLTEMETVQTLDDEWYNYPGGGDPTRAVIADPPDTELNRAWARYHAKPWNTSIKLGRQRIILDNARFVGNVGWRQNEQTFDAVTLRHQPTERTDLFYSYVWDVNRIFGPDAGLDFEADTHLINASYRWDDIGKLTGFGYLIELTNAPANSSNTVGARFSGNQPLSEQWALGYEASYAYQTDTGDNPQDYAAHYYRGEVALQRKDWANFAVGYEVLGSDDGNAAFRTPLATLHAFQGWADVFLTTPDVGVRDLYVSAGTTLPYDVQGKLVYHKFEADAGGRDLGHELDAVLKKQLTEHVDVLVKAARYDGDGGFADRTKFWLQTELTF